jgi:hypothetical protein
MTAKERQQMQRLQIENAELRAAVANHMRIYGDNLIEIIELKATLELVKEALK